MLSLCSVALIFMCSWLIHNLVTVTIPMIKELSANNSSTSLFKETALYNILYQVVLFLLYGTAMRFGISLYKKENTSIN